MKKKDDSWFDTKGPGELIEGPSSIGEAIIWLVCMVAIVFVLATLFA